MNKPLKPDWWKILSAILGLATVTLITVNFQVSENGRLEFFIKKNIFYSYPDTTYVRKTDTIYLKTPERRVIISLPDDKDEKTYYPDTSPIDYTYKGPVKTEELKKKFK